MIAEWLSFSTLKLTAVHLPPKNLLDASVRPEPCHSLLPCYIYWSYLRIGLIRVAMSEFANLALATIFARAGGNGAR